MGGGKQTKSKSKGTPSCAVVVVGAFDIRVTDAVACNYMLVGVVLEELIPGGCVAVDSDVASNQTKVVAVAWSSVVV